ncbi:MAG: c-type cytochrome domain-containing protein [Bacteroidota bacterium]
MNDYIRFSIPVVLVVLLFLGSMSSCVHQAPTKDCGGSEIPDNWPCLTRITACGETIYGPPFSTDTTDCLYITSCGETIIGEPVDTMACDVGCAPDTLYYEQDIVPILESNDCLACHTVANDFRGVILTSYEHLIQSNILIEGDPDNSELIEVVITTNTQLRMPPPPDPVMPDHDIAVLKEWIRQGAKNLACDLQNCDTISLSYATDIVPILQADCISCHTSGDNPGGEVILNTYAGVAEVAQDGSLLGSVAHWTGFSKMPRNADPLPDCDIIQLKRWIANGYKDN